jgi:hypothetical protein
MSLQRYGAFELFAVALEILSGEAGNTENPSSVCGLVPLTWFQPARVVCGCCSSPPWSARARTCLSPHPAWPLLPGREWAGPASPTSRGTPASARCPGRRRHRAAGDPGAQPRSAPWCCSARCSRRDCWPPHWCSPGCGRAGLGQARGDVRSGSPGAPRQPTQSFGQLARPDGGGGGLWSRNRKRSSCS